MRNDMDPYQQAIEDRIRDLHRYRRWMRSRYDRVIWRGLEKEYRQEAGALNRVRNRARRELRVDARGDHFVEVGR